MNRAFGFVAKACGLFVSALAVGCSATTSAAPRVAAHDVGTECAGRKVTSDAELAALAGCSEVQGELQVSNVTSLEPLAGLRRIEGDLVVSDTTELDDLAGLEQLESCKYLIIARNADLDDVSALARLGSVDSLNVSRNPELANLQGLSGLRRVNTLVLEHNGLYTTEGLEGVTEVGRMWIAHNPKLISIAALNHARFVSELVLKDNPRLSAYYGVLRGLARMPERAVVEGNRGITSEETALLWQRAPRTVAVRTNP